MKDFAGSVAPAALAGITGLALVLAIAWLGVLVMSPSRAVRARNAFLLRRGGREDFDWTPASVPSAFRREQGAPPSGISQAVNDVGLSAIDDEWDRARAIAGMLLRHWKADAPIRADLSTTYEGIVAGGGYCADYVRVFMAAASASGLFCRQWSFSFDGFGGHGHTVVEVWVGRRGRWAMLDVHNNVFAVREGADTPLDVQGLREVLLDAPATIEFRRAAEGRLGFRHSDKLVDYYRRGAHGWYLWFGNDVASRERRGIARWVAPLSGRLSHRLASAFGGLPAIVALATPDNAAAIARMQRLKRNVVAATALIVALIGLLWIQRPAPHA